MKVYTALYESLWEMGLINQVGQASGGSTTTVVDSSLALSADTKIGGSILIFETTDDLAPVGEIKRVTDNDTNTYTTDAFTAAVGAGDLYAYIAKDLNVYELIPAFNIALKKIGKIGKIDTSLAFIADTKKYDLPVSVKRGEIMNVAIEVDTENEDYAFLYDWRVQPAATGSNAQLVFSDEHTAGRTIKIEYIGYPDALTAFSDDLHETIPEELVKAAMRFTIDKMRHSDAIASQDGVRDLYNSSAQEFEQAQRDNPVWSPKMIKPARTFGRR